MIDLLHFTNGHSRSHNVVGARGGGREGGEDARGENRVLRVRGGQVHGSNTKDGMGGDGVEGRAAW